MTFTRAELDAAIDASATPDGRSEWLFDYNQSRDGTEVTVRAVAAPVRTRRTADTPDVPVGGVEVPPDRFASVVLAALIHQGGGSAEVQIGSYQEVAHLVRAGRPLTLRPVPGPDASDHFTIELASPDIQAGDARRSRTLPPPR